MTDCQRLGWQPLDPENRSTRVCHTGRSASSAGEGPRMNGKRAGLPSRTRCIQSTRRGSRRGATTAGPDECERVLGRPLTPRRPVAPQGRPRPRPQPARAMADAQATAGPWCASPLPGNTAESPHGSPHSRRHRGPMRRRAHGASSSPTLPHSPAYPMSPPPTQTITDQTPRR
jgi:hypothetical protein